MTATIYYDGDCPFCSRYVALLNLRETVGKVQFVDLREAKEMHAELIAEGYDLDQGMVVDIDGRRVGGADAVQALAGMSTPSGVFNRMNRVLFGSSIASAVVYPVLRSGRWLTLMLMGRKVLNDTDDVVGQRQTLFTVMFSLFSLLHVFNYVFEYRRGFAQIDLWAIFVIALIVLMRPSSARRLLLLMLISTISTVIQAPASSNHTMLRTMVLIGYWLSFFYAFIRGRPVSDIFANFVLAGRGALLVMYFYGIFHKINTGFLDPAVSCATAVWDKMLPPISLLQGAFFDYAAIYGTFVIEGVLVIALLFPKTRHLGMLGGIAFHSFLTLSNFALYTSFTTLAISLHVLFLGWGQLDRINRSSQMVWLKENVRRPLYLGTFAILIVASAFFMLLDSYGVAAACIMPAVLFVCSLILMQGGMRPGDTNFGHDRPAYVIGAIVTALYFVNGGLPYLGLKTAQTVAMFSNLHVENGHSNHIVFPNAPGPFTYLDDVVIIDDPQGVPFFQQYVNAENGMVYYDVLGYLFDNPQVAVSFTLHGKAYTEVSAHDLQEDIAKTLHGSFIRKWFHFMPVQMSEPYACL